MMRAESKRLATVLDEKCAATPTHPAILYRDRTICYAELQDEILAAARSLFALGIGRGDRVGILLGNQPEWVVMAPAASYLSSAERRVGKACVRACSARWSRYHETKNSILTS